MFPNPQYPDLQLLVGEFAKVDGAGSGLGGFVDFGVCVQGIRFTYSTAGLLAPETYTQEFEATWIQLKAEGQTRDAVAVARVPWKLGDADILGTELLLGSCQSRSIAFTQTQGSFQWESAGLSVYSPVHYEFLGDGGALAADTRASRELGFGLRDLISRAVKVQSDQEIAPLLERVREGVFVNGGFQFPLGKQIHPLQ
ncbi:MAG: hypothetical protein AB7P04_09665 [Bacteriovoracia bacterium]